jgi:serine protease inhibitor
MATRTINNWISSATKGLIKEAVNPATDTTGMRLMLINAIAFIGEWKKPFASTCQGDFELAKDNFKRVTYMNKVDMLYAGTTNLGGHSRAIWIEIPYDVSEIYFHLKNKQKNKKLISFLSEK